MNRMSFIVMFLALVLGFTQCKKEQPVVTPQIEGDTVTITLDVNSGNNNGSKVIVNPPHVTFENGDVIYVASGGKYVGTLTHNGSNFSGSITNPIEGEKLHFYFLGNMTPAETLTAGATTGCSVVISDQTQKRPVISYAPSAEDYASNKSNYTAELENQCALVKFVVNTASSSDICITGLNNHVTVDFSSSSFSYDQINNGLIKVAARKNNETGNFTRWVILLPQARLFGAVAYSAYSDDGCYVGKRAIIPDIVKNNYLEDGIDITVNTSTTPPIESTTGALFTVSETKSVWFSKGNLMYNGHFSFASNQWSVVGSGQATGNDGTRDLFGWGTSGYNHGAVCYQPWETDTDNSKYYAYGDANANLYDSTGQADWGYGMTGYGSTHWRTLTSSEWNYVFFDRRPASGIRFAPAKVAGKNGMILLPDLWDESYYTLNSVNKGPTPKTLINAPEPRVYYEDNTISESDWRSHFNSHGAVFLPAAGWRDGLNRWIDIHDVGTYIHEYYYAYHDGVCYWASDGQGSYFFYTHDDYLETDPAVDILGALHSRSTGRAVRLVIE